MTAAEFYKLVLTLWGEGWRPKLRELLEKHGHHYRRQSYWNWRKGKCPVPEPIAMILTNAAKEKGTIV